MKPSSALGFFGVALAMTENICGKLTHKPVLVIACINVDTHNSVVVENETAVIVVTVLYGIKSRREVRPCRGIGRGSRFIFKGFHGDFATITSTNPLSKRFQFFGYVLIMVHQISPLLFATLRSRSPMSFHRVS